MLSAGHHLYIITHFHSLMRPHFTDEDTKLPEFNWGHNLLKQKQHATTLLVWHLYLSFRLQQPRASLLSHFTPTQAPRWQRGGAGKGDTWLQDRLALQGKVTWLELGSHSEPSDSACKLPGLLPATLSHSCPCNQGNSWEGPCNEVSTGDLLEARPGGGLGSVPQTIHHRTWRLKTAGLEERTTNSHVL